MTDEEALQQTAEVIEKTNDLEMRMALVLSKCLLPVTLDYGFLLELILHNTLVSFSAKVQLIERILDYWSWDDLKKKIGLFREIMKLRNAFAHTPLAKRQLLVHFLPDSEYGNPIGSQYVVEKRVSTSWENLEREETFRSFVGLHSKCIEIVKAIAERIEKTISQPSTPPLPRDPRTGHSEGEC
jgi:hypothetical protein